MPNTYVTQIDFPLSNKLYFCVQTWWCANCVYFWHCPWETRTFRFIGCQSLKRLVESCPVHIPLLTNLSAIMIWMIISSNIKESPTGYQGKRGQSDRRRFGRWRGSLFEVRVRSWKAWLDPAWSHYRLDSCCTHCFQIQFHSHPSQQRQQLLCGCQTCCDT